MIHVFGILMMVQIHYVVASELFKANEASPPSCKCLNFTTVPLPPFGANSSSDGEKNDSPDFRVYQYS